MTAANSLTDLRVYLVASVIPRHPWYRLLRFDGGDYQIINTEGDPMYPVVEHLDRERVLDVIQRAADESTHQSWVVRLDLESDVKTENRGAVEQPPLQTADHLTASTVMQTLVGVASTLEFSARCQGINLTEEQVYDIYLKSIDKMLDAAGGIDTARTTLAAALTQLVMMKRERNPL